MKAFYLLLVVFLSLGFAPQKLSDSSNPQTANTVLFYGDSITQDPVGWSDIFCTLHGFTKENHAVIGSVMTQNLQSIQAFDITQVPQYNAQVHKYLFLCYGVNDINNYGQVSNFITSYNSAISGILAKGFPAQKIIILSEWLFDISNFWTPALKQSFVAATASVAQSYGCINIDVYNPVLAEPDNYKYFADNLHPNSLGKVRWAQVVENGYNFTTATPAPPTHISVTGFKAVLK